MTVELIRHGETRLQREHRYQGRTDEPLSAEGAAALRPDGWQPERVYVSSLLRARQTAEILFPGARQIVVPGLEEMDFGRFEGRNFAELARDAAYRDWVDGGCIGRCPGGEDKDGFCARVCGAFAHLLDAELVRPHGEACIQEAGKKQIASIPMDKKQCHNPETVPDCLARHRQAEVIPNGTAECRERDIIIVAHGGTLMAVMERFGIPRRPYFDWQRPGGSGFQLDAAEWEMKRVLRLMAETSYV